MRCKFSGWLYNIEHISRSGRVLSVERVHNLCPIEGRNYLLSIGAAGGSQIATWFCGIFEGDYTPIDGSVMSTFSGLATESTAYAEATRPEWVEAAPAAGVITNAASKAVFTINATKTFYGGFLSSSAVKGGTGGILLSAARFSTAKAMASGEILRITGSMTSVSS